jgi:hypothetical protein
MRALAATPLGLGHPFMDAGFGRIDPRAHNAHTPHSHTTRTHTHTRARAHTHTYTHPSADIGTVVTYT